MPRFFGDVTTVFLREIRPETRSPVSVIFAMGQPVLFLVLFGSMLVGPGTGGIGAVATWLWFVPGILVMMCLMGPLSAGHSLLNDLVGGQLERFLVTPISRTAIIIGRTGKDIVILIAQTILLVGIAISLGMRLHLLGALLTMVLLVVVATGLSALSYLLAIASAPSGTLFWTVTQMLVFPIMLLSGILLPVDAGPAWLGVVAAINPITYVVEAARALFIGNFSNISVLYGAAVAFGIAGVGLVLSTRAMKQRSLGR